MTTPIKTRRTSWWEDDTKWFSNHPGRTFCLRRLCDGERVNEEDYTDGYGEIPTHALIIQNPQIRHILRCHDGVNGKFFDFMLRSKDEVCTDVVCAAIWGRTIFDEEPWDWEDLETLFKLAMGFHMGWLRHEWLP